MKKKVIITFYSTCILCLSLLCSFDTKHHTSDDGWRDYKTITGVAHYGKTTAGTYEVYMTTDEWKYKIETRVYNGKTQYCITRLGGGWKTYRLPVKKSPVKKYNSCCCFTGSCNVLWCFNL